MNPLRKGHPRVQSQNPRIRAPRKYWISIIILVTFMWPLSGLTYWHLTFFCALSVGIYSSYSRNILPLMVYFSTILLYWVVAPIIQLQVGVGYYIWSSEISQFGPQALAFGLTHILGILGGYQFIRLSRTESSKSKLKFSIPGLTVSIYVLFLLIIFIGFRTIVYPRAEQETGDAASYMIMLRNIVKLLPAMLICYVLLESDNGVRKRTSLVVLIILALILLVVSNPVNTSRFLSLFGIVVIFIAYALKFSKLRLLSWALAIAPIYAVFMLAITSSMRSGLERINLTKVFQSLQSLEFSSFSIFLDALKVHDLPSDNYLISHLFIIIPRNLWPWKADSIGIDVAERSGYVFNNVGLISSFNSYADYGIVGLFIFSLLIGALARNLNPTLFRASFHNRRFMYGVLFTGMMPMFFRGDLSTAMLAFYPAILVYETVRFTTRFRFILGVR